LNPSVGYFISDKFVLGLSPFFNYKKMTFNYSDLGMSGFGRLYFQNIFLHGAFGLGYGKETLTTVNSTTTYSYATGLFELGIGYALFITDNTSFDIMIKLRSNSKVGINNSDLLFGNGYL
jgi:hypothetical protein